MIESWKDIPGFEGIYQVSNCGRLASFKVNPQGRVLSNVNATGGYFSVVLRYGGKVRYTRMHRLVAEAFIPNPENKPEVNHKDLNKQNTYASNLEWSTYSENVKHAIKAKPEMITGMNHYNQVIRPKRIRQLNLNGDFIAEYRNGTDAAKASGVCSRNILQVAGKDEYKPGLTRKQAGGFIWEYVEIEL